MTGHNMTYHTIKTWDDYREFSCDDKEFTYPAKVEDFKEEHGENAILLLTEPIPAARGANLVAYGRDAIVLFRIFGEYNEKQNLLGEETFGRRGTRTAHLFYDVEDNLYSLIISYNDLNYYKPALQNYDGFVTWQF